MLLRVNRKHARIASLIESFAGRDLDAHYLGFFDCFNRQRYFEAHEVLEDLWLAERGGPRDSFYKGLIQLAGAFVHLQKNRRQPAVALFKLAQTNLGRYPAAFERLELDKVLGLIGEWLGRLELAPADELFPIARAPRLALQGPEPRGC